MHTGKGSALLGRGPTPPSPYLLGTQRLRTGALRKLPGLGGLCPLLRILPAQLVHPRLEVAQLLHHARH